jgi:predicted enzyme related to lactoylglutathione lyase
MNVFFEIQADDVSRAVNFYKEVFGWEFTKEKNLSIEYYRIWQGDAIGGLLKRPAKTPPMESGTNAFVCSYQVEDFDKAQDKILSLNGQIALSKFAVPGKCWQGYFMDTEGNTFGIFEVDENAK